MLNLKKLGFISPRYCIDTLEEFSSIILFALNVSLSCRFPFMLKKIFQEKIFKFIVCGIVTATFNILLVYGIIKFLKFNTPFLRNIANVLAIELSLIFSFFVYKIWVWSAGTWTVREVLWQQIPLYHISVGATVMVRSFILFPLFDWFGIHYVFNTLLGVLLGSVLNYFSNEKFVFKTKK